MNMVKYGMNGSMDGFNPHGTKLVRLVSFDFEIERGEVFLNLFVVVLGWLALIMLFHPPHQFRNVSKFLLICFTIGMVLVPYQRTSIIEEIKSLVFVVLIDGACFRAFVSINCLMNFVFKARLGHQFSQLAFGNDFPLEQLGYYVNVLNNELGQCFKRMERILVRIHSTVFSMEFENSLVGISRGEVNNE